jgi:hypothetical protein
MSLVHSALQPVNPSAADTPRPAQVIVDSSLGHAIKFVNRVFHPIEEAQVLPRARPKR